VLVTMGVDVDDWLSLLVQLDQAQGVGGKITGSINRDEQAIIQLWIVLLAQLNAFNANITTENPVAALNAHMRRAKSFWCFAQKMDT